LADVILKRPTYQVEKVDTNITIDILNVIMGLFLVENSIM